MEATTGAPAPAGRASRARAEERAGPLPHGLVAELRRAVGADGLITDPGALLVYESDGLTAYRAAPRAVVLPRGTADVAAVVRLLAEAGVPFVARGAGTGLSGGALALGGAVVLSLARMNRILELDPADRRARVQAGVVNLQLGRAAAAHGLHYAPDPSSQTVCTIGGNVAENAGGPHCLKYGVTSNHVVGLTVVLPGGDVVELGGPGEPPGYDLVGLLVGSEGTLGVVTEVEVRLVPAAEAVETLMAVFDSAEDAGRAVTAIMAEGLLPAALEMIDREAIRAVEESIFAAGYPTDAAGILVIEFDGSRAGLVAEAERAAEICAREGAREVRRARDEAERLRLWHGRKKAFGAMGRLAPDVLVQDATVPRSRLPDVLARVYDVAGRYGLRVCNMFHAGDGNVHPTILFDRRDPDQLRRVELASSEIMRACVEVGGTITGEHGVGLDKREYMPLIFGPAELDLMDRVRRTFDPRGLANPGKVLPGGGEKEGTPPPAAFAPPALGGGKGRGAGSVAAVVRALLGDDGVLEGAAALRWAVHGLAPRVVAAPATAEEAAAVLELASAEGWSVEPAGAGTRGHEGLPPRRLDLVLTTERLRGVLGYEPADMVLEAAAGTPVAEIRECAARERQWLALDPPAAPGATLGGLIATAAAGPLRLAHGTPRDHVLGLELVAGDGRILRLGGRVVKNVAGYDLVKLVVGSRGTLGLVTRAFVRLRPIPELDLTLLAGAARPEPLLALAAAARAGRLEPAALELLSPRAARAAAATGGWALLARFQGNREAVEAARAGLEAGAAGTNLRALEPGEAAAAWEGLSSLEADAAMIVRLAGRASDLDHTLRIARRLPPPGAPPLSLAAHAGSGIVRLIMAPDAAGPALPEAWAAPLAAARAELAARRGTLTVPRGPAEVLERVAPWGELQEPAIRLLRELKERFDPAGILMPDRSLV